MTHVVIIDHCSLSTKWSGVVKGFPFKTECILTGVAEWNKMIISNKGVEYY